MGSDETTAKADSDWLEYLAKVELLLSPVCKRAISSVMARLRLGDAKLPYPKSAIFDTNCEMLWELEKGTMIVKVSIPGQVDWDFFAGSEGYRDLDHPKALTAIAMIFMTGKQDA